MIQGYMLTQVSCRKCGVMLQCQPPLFAPTEAKIEQMAETVHGSTKLICSEPLIIAVYVLAMVAPELIEQPLVVGAETNGKPAIIH